MPALITARQTDIDLVRMLAARLVQDGGEVRCYLEADDHELRNLGCKLAVGPLDDEFNLEAALTNVHTFIVLYPTAEFGAAAARAAGESGVTQTIVAQRVGSRSLSDFQERVSHVCSVWVGPQASIQDIVTALSAADDRENNDDVVSVGIESTNEL